MFLTSFEEFGQTFVERFDKFFQEFGWTFLSGLVAAIIGWFLVKLLRSIIKRILYRSPIDNTIVTFLISIISVVLYMIYIFVVASIWNIPMDSVLALVASAGVAVGLALQNSLSNIANGILLVTTKPFKEGDFVSINGIDGTIQAINMVTTVILTTDNKVITIPNNTVMNSSITNYNGKKTRRLDMKFTAAYGSDLDYVEETLKEICKQEKLIINNPAPPFVAFKEQGDSALIFIVRVWVNAENYWSLYFDFQKKAYKAFQEKNIDIPFNTVKVEIDKE